MAVDYLSAINQGGSGLNITQIVDSLVEAEQAPQEDQIQTKIDAKNTAISAIGEIKSSLSKLSTVLLKVAGDSVTPIKLLLLREFWASLKGLCPPLISHSIGTFRTVANLLKLAVLGDALPCSQWPMAPRVRCSCSLKTT